MAILEGAATDFLAKIYLPRQDIKVIYNSVVTPNILLKAQDELNQAWFSLKRNSADFRGIK